MISNSSVGLHTYANIIGTIGRSGLIDSLVRNGKINIAAGAGKRKSFQIQVVPNPLPGVESALVVAGIDKRGTIYGIYDSEQIAESPYYWWADVPVRHASELFIKPGVYVQGPPGGQVPGNFSH